MSPIQSLCKSIQNLCESLERIAVSYEEMSRVDDGRIHCSIVFRDIRENIIAPLAALIGPAEENPEGGVRALFFRSKTERQATQDFDGKNGSGYQPLRKASSGTPMPPPSRPAPPMPAMRPSRVDRPSFIEVTCVDSPLPDSAYPATIAINQIVRFKSIPGFNQEGRTRIDLADGNSIYVDQTYEEIKAMLHFDGVSEQ